MKFGLKYFRFSNETKNSANRRAMRGGGVGHTRERLTDPEWQNQATWGNCVMCVCNTLLEMVSMHG